MRFFFYGTLRDPDVRRAVIGPGVGRVAIRPAKLANYECVFMRGRSYPVLRRAPGGWVEGVLADGIDSAQATRIDRFETGEYRAAAAQVMLDTGEAVEATVYVAARPGLATARPWRFADWQRRMKPRLVRGWFRGGP